MRSSLLFVVVGLVAFLFASVSKGQSPTSCCAPAQWTISGTEKTNFGVVSHYIAYDSVKQFVRWDRKGYIESSTSVLYLSLYSFYPQAVEYVVDITTKTCLPYGPDGFVEWCFGKGSAMQYAFNMTIGGSQNINWVGTGSPTMNWVSDPNCFPVYFQSTDSTTLFYSPSLGVNPNNWVLPTYCNASTEAIPRSAKSPMSLLFQKYFGAN
eukprot:TRINITY_DN265_c0_g1_i8.p1 TRINITY_DN265_c0_g1~~TRINITY_DN265_c0_g1_i8.p1  ORF type:complete len:209 (-),score=42.73 TRINITY_DN265_c0_g1_i8:63-689(-)